MKSVVAFALALVASVAVLSASPAAFARSPELVQVEQIVDTLEGDYRLNISLIPQPSDSERIWLHDLKKLTNIMDNNISAPAGSLNSLHCDKLVCRSRN